MWPFKQTEKPDLNHPTYPLQMYFKEKYPNYRFEVKESEDGSMRLRVFEYKFKRTIRITKKEKSMVSALSRVMSEFKEKEQGK